MVDDGILGVQKRCTTYRYMHGEECLQTVLCHHTNHPTVTLPTVAVLIPCSCPTVQNSSNVPLNVHKNKRQRNNLTGYIWCEVLLRVLLRPCPLCHGDIGASLGVQMKITPPLSCLFRVPPQHIQMSKEPKVYLGAHQHSCTVGEKWLAVV